MSKLAVEGNAPELSIGIAGVRRCHRNEAGQGSLVQLLVCLCILFLEGLVPCKDLDLHMAATGSQKKVS